MKYYSELEYNKKENELLKVENKKVKTQLKELLDRERKEKNQATGPSIDYNDFYRNLLHLVRLEGDDPVWKKFANVAEPAFNVMDGEEMKRMAQNLWA